MRYKVTFSISVDVEASCSELAEEQAFDIMRDVSPTLDEFNCDVKLIQMDDEAI